MTTTKLPRLILLLSAVLTCFMGSNCQAVDSADDLQWSVRRLNTWLGDSDQAIGWRKYLLLNVLESQAAKGHRADFGTLSRVRDRFASGVTGSDHPAFVDVRNAIDRQLASLRNSYRGELSDILMAHVGQFQAITVEHFDHVRSRASYDLKVLKKYYRSTMASRQRAELFYDLQLDPMMEFIDSVVFERAPEISVGKLSSMIAEKKRALRDITREIDALPDEEIQRPKMDRPQPDRNDDQIKLDEPGHLNTDDGPVPDNSSTLDDLKRRQTELKAAIKEISARRKEVLKADRPRLIRRRDTLLKMKDFKQRFDDLSNEQFDPYFVTAATSYDQFIQTYANGTADNLQEDMLRRIEVLSEDLPLLGLPDERRAAGRVANLLQWLENSNQVPSLVSAIRRDYSLPNLYLNISSNLINAAAAQSAVATRVLDENVNGRLIRGYATTSTNVNLELQDDPNQVHLSIHLLGSIASNTRFRERKFYGFVNANGQFEGRRSLYANIGGLFAGDSKVAANVSTDFLGLTTKCDLIQKLAFKQFNEGKADADADAARRAELEAFEEFDSLTSEAVIGGQDAIFDINDRAIDYAAWIPDLFLRSSTDFIEAVGKLDSAGSLAAPNYPAASSVPVDVTVRLHDSLLSNLVDPIFAGKTFSNEELAAKAAELSGETPKGLATEDGDGAGEDESFSITFDSVRPIQFEFEGNAVTVSVSGKQFSQGDRKIDAGLQISVRFKIKRSTDGLQLVRDGEAEIDYTDPDRKDAKIVAFKSFLEDKLNSEANQTNAIDLPANLLPIDEVAALRSNKIARDLKLVQCMIEDGWFYLGWRHLPGSASSAAASLGSAGTLGSTGYTTDLPAIWNEITIDQYETDFDQSGDSILSTDENAPPIPSVEGELQVQ